MDAKQFLLSKGIFDYQYIVDYDGESIELEKLLTDYAQALQLQQTGVVRSNLMDESPENRINVNRFNEDDYNDGYFMR